MLILVKIFSDDFLDVSSSYIADLKKIFFEVVCFVCKRFPLNQIQTKSTLSQEMVFWVTIYFESRD